MDKEIPKQRLVQLSRDLGKLYPTFGKKFIERLEEELGKTYKYKDASLQIFKLYKD